MSVLRRLCLVVPAAVVVLATAGAGSALASQLYTMPDPESPGSDAIAHYVAAPGEVNDVTVSPVDLYTIRVTDPGAVIATGTNCTSIDAHTAQCSTPPKLPRPYIRTAAVQAGDMDDRVESTGRLSPGLRPADGGPGDDTLIGSAQLGDVLDGGGGHDTLIGRGNRDTLTDGDDPRHPDADVLNGGGDNDTVSYADRTARVFVDLGNPRTDGEKGERDKLIAINSVVGGSGDDRLSGSGGYNHLEGMRGDDRVEGRGGSDSLHGGRGHDVVLGRLGSDTIVGGLGNDHLYGSHGDDQFRLKSGDDRLDCGRADDATSDARAGDFLEPGCEEVSYGHFHSSAYPVRHHRSSIDFRIGCVRRNQTPLRGSMRIRESGGRRRTLARRTIHRSARPCQMHPMRDLTVRLYLTSLGRRKAARDKGIHSTVSLRGYSFQNVDWTIELHNG